MGIDTKKNREKWVKALRSGKFRQTRHELRNGRRREFCCLGVATELYRKATGNGGWDKEGFFINRGERDGGACPVAVQEWLGLRTDTGNMPNEPALTEYNDVHEADFNQIADVIEREPEGLFND